MNKIALITGASGFVGPYLRKELEDNVYKVYGLDRSENSDYQVDILNYDSVLNAISEINPDFVFHLAGFSSVKDSFNKPDLCKKINVDGTKNLLKAIENVNKQIRILTVSSAQVYGNPKYLPIDENHPLESSSPYSESRILQEKFSLESNLNVIISRSFNHTGPNQQLGFVCPDFISEVKMVLSGEKEFISVGNLEAKRDISDVRDVVRAYRTLLEKGTVGEIYNICSGKEISVQEILNKIIKIAGLNSSRICVDKNKFRPVDVPSIYGDNSKMKNLGWEPQYSIDQTLEDMWNER
jgi:GDP-4-dehydro-6-deoxy-D-mannose reductase